MLIKQGILIEVKKFLPTYILDSKCKVNANTVATEMDQKPNSNKQGLTNENRGFIFHRSPKKNQIQKKEIHDYKMGGHSQAGSQIQKDWGKSQLPSKKM